MGIPVGGSARGSVRGLRLALFCLWSGAGDAGVLSLSRVTCRTLSPSPHTVLDACVSNTELPRFPGQRQVAR